MAATKKNGADPRILTWEEIVAVQDLGEETVLMPEWGDNVAVRIRGLSMDDLYKARKAAAAVEDPIEKNAILDMMFLKLGIVEPEMPDAALDVLRQKSSDAIPRLIKRIAALNGSTKEALAAAVAGFPAERGG